MSWLDDIKVERYHAGLDAFIAKELTARIVTTPEKADRLISEARLMEKIREAEDDIHVPDLETLGDRVADIINADEQPDKETR